MSGRYHRTGRDVKIGELALDHGTKWWRHGTANENDFSVRGLAYIIARHEPHPHRRLAQSLLAELGRTYLRQSASVRYVLGKRIRNDKEREGWFTITSAECWRGFARISTASIVFHWPFHTGPREGRWLAKENTFQRRQYHAK